MDGWQEVDDIQMSDAQKFDDVIKDVEAKIKNIPHHHKHIPLDYREFEQFKRGWFYRHWENRFRRLGQVGVVAIPNTTLQDWIIWLYEWSQKMTDDYNEFKRLVYEAIKLHEEHLQIHDAQIKDLQERVAEIERQIKEIWNKINEILSTINRIWDEIANIKNEINNLKNEINQLKANNEKLNKIIQNLTNSGAWNPDTNDFNSGRNIATGNINFFGGAQDGASFIRTNNGHTENDVTAGI